MSLKTRNVFQAVLEGSFDTTLGEREYKCIFSIADSDKDTLLTTLLNYVRASYALRRSQFNRMRLHSLLYHGIHYKSQWEAYKNLGFYNNIDTNTLTALGDQVVINKIRTLVEQEINRVTRQDHSVVALPQSGDFDDKVNAKMVAHFCHHKAREEHLQSKLVDLYRQRSIYGEAYKEVYWNPYKGYEDEAYRKLKEEDEVIEIENERGEKIKIERPVYQGDVDFRVRHPWEVGLDYTASTREEVEWCFFREIVPVEKLKVEYPDNADEIRVAEDLVEYEIDSYQGQKRPEHTVLIRFFHRRTPEMPNGMEVVMTPDVILHKDDISLPKTPGSEFGELPIEMITDCDSPGTVHGWSRLELLTTPQAILNNVYTLWRRNLFMIAHPRVLAEEGSIARNKFVNAPSFLFYKRGYSPPAITTFPSINSEVPALAQAIEQKMDQIYGSHPISRGEVGSNIRSAAQMQFLEAEQEESEGILLDKYRSLILSVYSKMLTICADKYDVEDKRLVKYLSDAHRWEAEHLDVEKLKRGYELELQVSPDIPRRKDARSQLLMQMVSVFPEIDKKKVLRMLKFGAVDEFMDLGAQATTKAEREDYMHSRGKDYIEPKPYDKHISHLHEHYRTLQSPNFMDWPEDRQERVVAHVRTHEYLLFQHMRKSPATRQQVLMELADFPLVFEPPQDSAMGPQVANMGQLPQQQSQSQSPAVKQQQTPQGGPGNPVNAITQGRNVNGTFGAARNGATGEG